jgi:hypothetical protein
MERFGSSVKWEASDEIDAFTGDESNVVGSERVWS